MHRETIRRTACSRKSKLAYAVWGVAWITLGLGNAVSGQSLVGSGANPAVDVGLLGQSVIVWEANDGDEQGVLVRRFDAVGMPLGNAFFANATTEGAQVEPDVSILPDGTFVVVWESRDRNKPRVLGQCFDSIGMPLGNEAQINGGGAARFPAIASDDIGDFVVTWSRSPKGQPTTPKGSFRVEARRFDGIGMPLGNIFRVAKKVPVAPPAVAKQDGGDFLISWQSKKQDVQGLVFDSIGMPLGNIFRINASTAGDQATPSATSINGGDFAVTWERSISDTGLREVYVRLIDSIGMPLGNENRVNFTTSIADAVPSVAAAPATGELVVSWHCQLSQDATHASVFARAIDGIGTPVGSEFQINMNDLNVHLEPEVAASSDGYVVVWERQNGSSSDVQADALEVP